jgi:hypothetical protein
LEAHSCTAHAQTIASRESTAFSIETVCIDEWFINEGCPRQETARQKTRDFNTLCVSTFVNQSIRDRSWVTDRYQPWLTASYIRLPYLVPSDTL